METFFERCRWDSYTVVSRRQKPTLVPGDAPLCQQHDVTLQVCAGGWDGNLRRPARFAGVSSASRPRPSSILTSARGGQGVKIRPESPAGLQPLDSRAVGPAARTDVGKFALSEKTSRRAHGPFDLTSEESPNGSSRISAVRT